MLGCVQLLSFFVSSIVFDLYRTLSNPIMQLHLIKLQFGSIGNVMDNCTSVLVAELQFANRQGEHGEEK